jgi:peptidoglycan/xylan/chitin deacetylase (PgdA/CDA1 family)
MRGVRGFCRAVRWLRSRVVRGGLILLYHRVAVSSVDPFNLCVTPEHFRTQMAALRSWANPMSLVSLLSASARGEIPPRAVAVTFDDGYFDTLRGALPALIEHNIPATMFVTTGNPGEPFWWDRLCYQILNGARLPSRLELQAGEQSYSWSINSASRRHLRRLFREIHMLCRRLPIHTRGAVVKQIEAWSGREVPNDVRALTAIEIKQLASASTVTIGAHTVNHPTLSDLTSQEQLYEMRHSRADLEALLGRTVTEMSYPSGLPGRDYNEDTVRLARAAGYTCACAAHTDIVHAGADAMQLPRYWVYDWSGDQLIRHLAVWLR